MNLDNSQQQAKPSGAAGALGRAADTNSKREEKRRGEMHRRHCHACMTFLRILWSSFAHYSFATTMPIQRNPFIRAYSSLFALKNPGFFMAVFGSENLRTFLTIFEFYFVARCHDQ